MVVLNCSGARHVFHEECLAARLGSGWNGAAIEFGFLKCPLCESRVQHPRFDRILAPYLALEEKVWTMNQYLLPLIWWARDFGLTLVVEYFFDLQVGLKALERLGFEGLEQDKAIVQQGGRYYQDPRAFALHHFAFYQCFEV